MNVRLGIRGFELYVLQRMQPYDTCEPASQK